MSSTHQIAVELSLGSKGTKNELLGRWLLFNTNTGKGVRQHYSGKTGYSSICTSAPRTGWAKATNTCRAHVKMTPSEAKDEWEISSVNLVHTCPATTQRKRQLRTNDIKLMSDVVDLYEPTTDGKFWVEGNAKEFQGVVQNATGITMKKTQARNYVLRAKEQSKKQLAPTELDKMLNGELYDLMDPQLVEMRGNAKQVCFELNQTAPKKVEKRKALTKKLLGVDHAVLEPPFHVDYGCHLKVGTNFVANHGCTIQDSALITVGDNCVLAPHVCITTLSTPPTVRVSPITIGDNVWIGANATICQGVTIGNNVVVEAGAVVKQNVPDNVVVSGVPAKVIRTRTLSNGETQEDSNVI